MSSLLDTCVLSEFTKPLPNAGLVAWLDEQDELTLHVSVLTFGELHKGIVRLPNSKRRKTLASWLEQELMPRFAGRSLDITAAVALRWGQIQGIASKQGQPLPVIDSLIAATALENDLVVVTRNARDIARAGARVLDPWR